jgi:hypothetical protein
MVKNRSYEHEKEVRALIIGPPLDGDIPPIDIPINLGDFVESIIVNPLAPSWLSPTVRELAARYQLAAQVLPSSLSPTTFYGRD